MAPLVELSLRSNCTGTFFLAAYCVYEVYSWDVMEPATYFLMVSDSDHASGESQYLS